MRIALFGSTGSIGVNTLDVIRQHLRLFDVEYLTTYRQIDKLADQIDEFKPSAVVVLDPQKAAQLQKSHGSKTRVLCGEDALVEIAASDSYDTLVGALVGFAGLKPTLEAIKRGKRICIANKETLVVAGELLSALAKDSGSVIEPIDSEHSAIAQCLVGESLDSVKRIILTASGGPFRTREQSTFDAITVEDALKHPNWVMGRKITIDSATLMNKGLEVIEARWLFGLGYDKIDVIVHPQSIVHSMVEFKDGSVKAQLGAPDMRMPIQYALQAPRRLDASYELLDLLTTKPLEFQPPDTARFPALALAREAGVRGGVYPTILNAANEVVVEAFLDRRVRFSDIPDLIEEAIVLAEPSSGEPLDPSSTSGIQSSLKRIFEADRLTREFVNQGIGPAVQR